jgi:CMP-N-acetylneuraminic acid synthetase
MKVTSVILARGGSKGIPNKNLTTLGGRPLIHYSIRASLLSSCNETWVCTDSEKIAEVSSELGAKTLMRPYELARDDTPSEAALMYFAEKVDFETLVFIQPTSPLIAPPYINQGIRLVSENSYDSVFSAYEEHWVPRWTKNNEPFCWDPFKRPRRQDMPSILVENGAFYVTSKDRLVSSGLRYSGRVGHVLMKNYESIQIDTPDDIHLAERLLPQLYYH